MDWADHARQELYRSGHRSGGARDAVVRLLAEQPCCLSAQAIFDLLRERGETAGLASVYRAVDTLASLQLVHRVDVEGTACYEPADPSGHHHHHARCDVCGRMDSFEDAELERRLEDVLKRLGYTEHGHDVVLRGTCPDCASSASR